jgi:hypothetical protein
MDITLGDIQETTLATLVKNLNNRLAIFTW